MSAIGLPYLASSLTSADCTVPSVDNTIVPSTTAEDSRSPEVLPWVAIANVARSATNIALFMRAFLECAQGAGGQSGFHPPGNSAPVAYAQKRVWRTPRCTERKIRRRLRKAHSDLPLVPTEFCPRLKMRWPGGLRRLNGEPRSWLWPPSPSTWPK